MTGPILPTDLAALAVLCPSWVGDTVMATPVLRALRAGRPAARIVAVTRPGISALLRGLRHVDDLVEVDHKGATGALRVARALRATGAEAVLLLPNSFRAALAARLCGAAVRAGYGRDRRGFLLTHAVAVERRDEPESTVAYYAHLACAVLGAPSIDMRLELAVTGEEEAEADRLLDGVRAPFVLLNPGANRPDKRWPAERFAAVADALARSRGLATAVNGSPRERDVVSAVIAAIDPARRGEVVDLASRGVTLGGLKGVAARASLVVTNDTGPRHVAAALGTPVVALFGPTDHRWTRLEGARERVVVANPFLPGEQVADRNPVSCAIGRIAVGDVIAASEAVLA